MVVPFFESADINSSCSDLMHHVDAFYDAIAEVQPTVFFGTPAVYESLYYRLKELRRTMSGLQRMFLNWDDIISELFSFCISVCVFIFIHLKDLIVLPFHNKKFNI